MSTTGIIIVVLTVVFSPLVVEWSRRLFPRLWPQPQPLQVDDAVLARRLMIRETMEAGRLALLEDVVGLPAVPQAPATH